MQIFIFFLNDLLIGCLEATELSLGIKLLEIIKEWSRFDLFKVVSKVKLIGF